MHIGKEKTARAEYFLREGQERKKLGVITEEKDLGVYITSNLKPGEQCARACKRAMSVLGMIRRHFRGLDKEEFMILYKTYVRPHLEYCVQVWNPTLKKDIECLERVQRRATKLVKGLEAMSYEERLTVLRLTTLEKRRTRGDLLLLRRTSF